MNLSSKRNPFSNIGRVALASFVALSHSAASQPCWSAESSSAGTPVRIVAANLTSGNKPYYDEGSGARILKGLKPDVVLIQEFNYKTNSAADMSEFVNNTFGAGFHYYRQPKVNIPNGVVSHWPILEAGVWDDENTKDREFVYAKIDVPGPNKLWAVSVHLLTKNAKTRNEEATELSGYIKSKVPDSDFLVIGGDFNTNNIDESAIHTLADLVDTTHVPADQSGKTGTNRSRRKPYDMVLPDNDLAAHQKPVSLGQHEFSDGLVFDSRVFTPLDSVPPIQEEDSDAQNMQHMAVVKDFELPK